MQRRRFLAALSAPLAAALPAPPSWPPKPPPLDRRLIDRVVAIDSLEQRTAELLDRSGFRPCSACRGQLAWRWLDDSWPASVSVAGARPCAAHSADRLELLECAARMALFEARCGAGLDPPPEMPFLFSPPSDRWPSVRFDADLPVAATWYGDELTGQAQLSIASNHARGVAFLAVWPHKRQPQIELFERGFRLTWPADRG